MSTTSKTANTVAPLHSSARRRWKRWTPNWRGMAAILAFFVIWTLLAAANIGGFATIPTPWGVLSVFASEYFADPAYWESWGASFRRILTGFFIAQLIGIPLGLFLALRPIFHGLVFPIIELLRPVPPLAWVPLAILFWPTTEIAIIFIIFIDAFMIIVINTYDGVRHVKREHILLAESMGANRFQIFHRIIVPSVIPSIAVGMALGLTVTWNVVIAAEMIASDTGLGRLTWEGYVSQTPAVVIIGMVSIGMAGYLSILVLNAVEKWMMPWKRS